MNSASTLVAHIISKPRALGSATDEALIAAIAAGDETATRTLYNRYSARVFQFIVRRVGDHSIAEDVVSKAFVDVWRQAHRFEGRSRVSTWILSIARFKALSLLRRRPDEELDEEQAAGIEDPSDNPEVALEKRERSAIIRKCLMGLSAEHQEIIDLVYYHEKSIEEVAEIVGIPENTVKTRMFYARTRLGQLIRQHHDFKSRCLPDSDLIDPLE